MTNHTDIIKGAETLKTLLTNAEKVEFSKDGRRVAITGAMNNGKGTIQYSKSKNTLKFKKNLILDKVTDFYLKFFPESKSILYRIELGNEQIRGYVFLSNLIVE